MFTVSAPTHASLRAFKPNTVRANEFVDARARDGATTRDDADDATTRRDALSGRDARRVSERIRTRPDARRRGVDVERGREGRALKIDARGAAVDGVERQRARRSGGARGDSRVWGCRVFGTRASARASARACAR